MRYPGSKQNVIHICYILEQRRAFSEIHAENISVEISFTYGLLALQASEGQAK
jgi:hypothetical protein